MGKNKTGRFGIHSANTIRRTRSVSRHLKVTHNGQFKIVKKVKHVESEIERERIIQDFADQLDDGGLEASMIEGEKTSLVEQNPIWASDLVYSMNKKKRWLLPDLLQRDLLFEHEDYGEIDYRVVVVERETSEYCFGSKRPDCLSVTDSKSEKPYKAPKRNKYAYANDLLNKDRPSKKTRKKKELKAEDEVIDTEPTLEEPELIYEVCYARPKDSFPLNKLPRNCELPNVCGDIERKSGGRKGNKSKMNWKLQDYQNVNDDMWIEDYLYEDEDGVDEECNEYLITAARQPLTLNLLDAVQQPHQITAQKDTRNANRGEHFNSLSSYRGKQFGKGDLILTGEEKENIVDAESFWYEMKTAEERRERWKEEKKQKQLNKRKRNTKAGSIDSGMTKTDKFDVSEHREGKVSIHCTVTDAKPENIVRNYGEKYMESKCRPWKFAINITGDLIDNFKDKGDNRSARLLQDDLNHSVCVLFESSNMDYNDFRVSLFGISDCMATTRHAAQEMTSHIPEGSVLTMEKLMECVTRIAKGIPSKGILRHNVSRSQLVRKPLVALETVDKMKKYDYSCQRTEDIFRQLRDSSLVKEKQSQCCSTGESMSQNELCGVCYCSLANMEGVSSTALSTCQHWFCNECWKMHVTSRVENGQLTITCPAYNCDSVVDAILLMAFLPTHLYIRYWNQVCNIEIAKNHQTRKFCPSAHCDRFVEVSRVVSSEDSSPVIACDCGNNWCWHCREGAHWPATCLQAAAYRRKRQERGLLDRGSTISEVMIKPCPQCKYPLQKNGGCQWMYCNCRFSFCWTCLRGYNDHSRGKCLYPHKGRESRVLPDPVVSSHTESNREMSLYSLALQHSNSNRRHRIMLVKQASQKLAKVTFWKKVDFKSDLDSCCSNSTPVSGLSNGDQHSETSQVNVRSLMEKLNFVGSQTEASYTESPMLQELLKTANKITAMYSQYNFVIEYLAILVCYTARRQRNTQMRQILDQMKFITGQMHEILFTEKSWTSKNTWERLISITDSGERCVQNLVRLIPSIHLKIQQLED
ncbi:uncharacterized protein LOC144438128 [Glandiceps talaboti]